MMEAPDAAIDIHQIKKCDAGGTLVGVEFMGDTAAFVLSEGKLLLITPEGSQHSIVAHAGSILEAASTGDGLITVGDDGSVSSIAKDLSRTILFAEPRKRWVEHVAASKRCDIVWSVGREVYWNRNSNGPVSKLEVASSVGGLAFAPSGDEVAIAHYNGVTLWNLFSSELIQLSWKGVHQLVSYSPSSQFLVSAMREPAVHGWDLRNRSDVLLPNYPARVRSLSWSADSRFLATSGADRLTVLSFDTNDNPLARMPLLLAPYKAVVVSVAFHPKKAAVAVAYADGMVMLVRVPDGSEIVIKAPDEVPISAVRWQSDGSRLAIASEDGQCRVVFLS